MNAKQRIEEWQYRVSHFKTEADKCTNTPDGRALREIFLVAMASAAEELESARLDYETPHTPGPWHYDGPTDDGWVVTLPGSRRGGAERCITCEGWTGDEADANARLIAAAPDLLEAVEMVLKNEDSTLNEYTPLYDWQTLMGQLTFAARKARGVS